MNENNGTVNGFDSAEPIDAGSESTVYEKPVQETTEQASVKENTGAGTNTHDSAYNPYSSYTNGQYSYSSYSYTPNTAYGKYSGTGGSMPPQPPKKDGQRTFSLGAIVLCIVLSVVLSTATSLGIAFTAFNNEESNTSSDTAGTSSVSGTESNSSGISSTVISIEGNVESLVEAVYDKSAESVVGIRTKASVENFFGGSSESTGEGSGVIYTSDGYIITNFHVIENAVEYSASTATIEVFLMSDPDTPIDATVVGYNASADLAVIKIEKTGLPSIEIGASDDVKVGQYAVAIGCPGGIEFLGSVSYGIISGLNRTVTIDSIGSMELIQTDAAINPGNSGGALLNSSGQLIGINSSKLVDESFEGMGFAIPVNTVVKVITEIIENKDNPTPYIGIEIYKYDSKYLEKYSLPHGAAVKSVVSGAPAALAGIRAGDIITQFNKVDIEEYTDFIEVLDQCTPGTKVTAKIYRNGRYYSTTVTIGSNNSYN